MREWLVASGIVEGPDGLLLVQNRRRDGSLDWSPPGGVIEVGEGEAVLDGLTREVEEESGILVRAWQGPVWVVEAEAQDMGWHLRVEVHRAVEFDGELRVGDPDGIVVDARFVPLGDCRAWLASTWLPTHEPLVAWLSERWTESRSYHYRVDGAGRDAMTIVRV
ncbi:MAG TPA: NUDIX hydrolase [Acidimicrobiales bacterium]|nr:NUDIX hydrolase [Acidimicrobiales bacterium]